MSNIEIEISEGEESIRISRSSNKLLAYLILSPSFLKFSCPVILKLKRMKNKNPYVLIEFN